MADDIMGAKICKALGLNPNDVYSLKLSFEVGNDSAEISVGQFLRNEQGAVILKILKDYKLIPIGSKKKEREKWEKFTNRQTSNPEKNPSRSPRNARNVMGRES